MVQTKNTMPDESDEPDETAVIASVLVGDVNAYALLVNRHAHFISRLVASLVPGEYVEDVAHEAFVRAYTSLANYAPVAPFRNWLTTIATRSCHDFWRQHYRCREAPVSSLSEDSQTFLEHVMAASSREVFEQFARQVEARELLDLMLDQLSPMDRLVLVLLYVEEYRVKEVADMLDISMPNVKIRAFRARRKLNAFLKRSGLQGGLYELS